MTEPITIELLDTSIDFEKHIDINISTKVENSKAGGNSVSHVQALTPVDDSNEHDNILSDDEGQKIIWNMDVVSGKEKNISNDETIETENYANAVEDNMTFTIDFQDKSGVNDVKLKKVEEDPYSKIDPKDVSAIARRQLELLNSNGKKGRRKVPDTSRPAPEKKQTFVPRENPVYITVTEGAEVTAKLPMYLLGRNKDNPNEDINCNGRNPTPSRPGVKMPPSSLSSLVLTPKEIEQEISNKIAKKLPISNSDQEISHKTYKKPTSVVVLDNRVLVDGEKIELNNLTTSPTKTSVILNETPKMNLSKTSVLPNEPQIITVKKESGIEIPHGYILNDDIPEIVNEINITDEHNEEDLLAILEGDGDGSYYEEEISLQPNESNSKSSIQPTEPKLSEKEIAYKQIMSLPVKHKHNKKVVYPKGNSNRNLTEVVKIKKPVQIEKANLVDSLVSDWSDTDAKDQTDLKVKIEVDPLLISPEQAQSVKEISEIPKSVPIIVAAPSPSVKHEILNKEPPQAVFKRTRIIKKKIIWDPDAPETQFSYASLLGSSAKKPVVKKSAAKAKTPDHTISPEASVESSVGKRLNSTSPQGPNKKVKKSEIDRLLGDEGAVNMLNSLERESKQDDSEKNTNLRINKTRNVAHKQESDNECKIVPSSPKLKNKRDIAIPKTSHPKTTQKKKTREPGSSGKGNKSWDYVYSQRGGDDSMIIRRRSNSSYSSTSPRRLSLDVSHTNPSSLNSSENENNSENDSAPSSAKKMKTKQNFEFVKPNSKNTAISSTEIILANKKELTVTRSGRANIVTPRSKLNPVNPISPPPDNATTLTTKYHENFVQFNLTLNSNKNNKNSNYLTLERMKDIVKLLKSIESNKDYNCVLITSSNGDFCDGLDLKSIIDNSNPDKLQKSIKELSTNLLNFQLTLLNYKKPIFAGVQGNCKNLGVMILPLFDFVVSDSTAIFSTNYASLGQLPEGYAVVCQSNKIRQSLIGDLLYSCQKISSTTALENGLITHNIKSGYNEHLIKECSNVGSNSLQALQAMKTAKFRLDNLKKLETDLIDEQKTIIKHWASVECQERFKENIF